MMLEAVDGEDEVGGEGADETKLVASAIIF